MKVMVTFLSTDGMGRFSKDEIHGDWTSVVASSEAEPEILRSSVVRSGPGTYAVHFVVLIEDEAAVERLLVDIRDATGLPPRDTLRWRKMSR